jgi:hypothetical protein
MEGDLVAVKESVWTMFPFFQPVPPHPTRNVVIENFVIKRFTIATKLSCLQQVAEKLKSDGTLAKVQAELRAAVFLAMDGGSSTSSLNPRMEEFAKTSEGKKNGFVGGLGLVELWCGVCGGGRDVGGRSV